MLKITDLGREVVVNALLEVTGEPTLKKSVENSIVLADIPADCNKLAYLEPIIKKQYQKVQTWQENKLTY